MNKLNQYKKHKILVLNGAKTQNEHVDIDHIYINVNSFTKILKKMHEHLPIPFKEVWYRNWKLRIKEYDVIIVFDGVRGRDVIKYIHKVNPSARIIIYYVNKFQNGAKNDPRNYKSLPCELWSFDKNDCERVQMLHNPFGYDDVFSEEENRKAFYNEGGVGQEVYDAFFIGVDKNRLGTLLTVKALLEKYQYKIKIILKKAKNLTYENLTEEECSILTEWGIGYNDVIKYIRQSQCIIEIQDVGQNGLTLRAMESIFFKKKLITDNHDVLTCDFYKQENIFILGYDTEERLETFLERPYEPISGDIIKQYTWEAWLERFFS